MNRLQYCLGRILQIIPVLFVISIMVFFLMRFIGGDPAVMVLGDKATAEAIAAFHKRLGLDDPLVVQYARYMRNLFQGNLGDSIAMRRPVAELIALRMPVTIKLTLLSALISVLVSLPLGYMAGKHKDKPMDQGIRGLALVFIAMPSFWVGLLLMMLFGVKLGWLPAGGWDHSSPLAEFKSLLLPAITHSLSLIALLMRDMRNSVVDISRLDYVDFARSKGISEGEVKRRHIFRNALISYVTLLSIRIAYMLGGSVITESVFALPGIGKLMIDAIFGRDYTVVQSLVLLFATLVMVVNLITDIVYSFLDPRVSYK